MKKKPEEFRAIAHVATDLYNIARDGEDVGADQPGVLLYCTQSAAAHGEGARWALRDLIHAELRKDKGTPVSRRATKGTPGLVFHHEDDDGDGRYHITTGADAKCVCGAPHGTDRRGIPANDPQFGFKPPEAFCPAATAAFAVTEGRKA